jgi:radical SAM protein with 4Fe4S-binding SPASM domain
MKKIYFSGKYTLNPKIILRRSFLGFSIYNIVEDTVTEIDIYLYTVLTLFLHNATNFCEINDQFLKLGINLNLARIQDLLNNRKDLNDLLIESSYSYDVPAIYSKLKGNHIYEYTPESIDLFITNKCNLKCPHCYRNASFLDKMTLIPLKRFCELVDEMEYNRVRSLKITGGEPFLVSNLYDIVKYVCSKRIHVGILTNATKPLTDKWLNLLKSENLSLGISLDGANAYTHDIIRGQGSFKKTIENIKKLSEINANFSLTFTINKYNCHELNDIICLALALKAKALTFNVIEESGRALKNKKIYDNVSFNIDIIKTKIKELMEKYSRSPIRIEITDNHGFATEEKDIKQIKEKEDLIICKAGFASLAIDSLLNVYPCIYGIGGKKEYRVGNLMNRSLMDVWDDSKFYLFRGGIKLKDLSQCSKCKMNELCNLKYCRLRSVYEGKTLYDTVSFCEKNRV